MPLIRSAKIAANGQGFLLCWYSWFVSPNRSWVKL